jgi:carbon monoxide dehydrogenase subunit G
MRVEKQYTFTVDQETLWNLILDPTVISKVLPGVQRIEAVGPDEYNLTASVGVGPVRGSFSGYVKISEKEPPRRYRLQTEMRGGPGFVRGEGEVELVPADGRTTLVFRGDIVIGGTLASVGQRLLDATATMLMDQGFKSLEAEIRSRLQK